MSSDNNIETLYDILQVSSNASIDEIKKNYKKLALRFHPDKNLDNTEETTIIFNKIRDAYEVLSDNQRRAWYDKHKDLFHKPIFNQSEYEIDKKYFTSACYDQFDDEPNGFYTVYRNLFEDFAAKENAYLDEDFVYPNFGNSKSSIETVKYFYDIWQSFSTALKFEHLDKWDLLQSPNRKVFRIMQRENNKIRDQARKQRNTAVRSLVQMLRRKDKRMVEYRAILEAKNKENRQKSELNRRRIIENNLKSYDNYVEPDWSSMKTLEKELEIIESDYKKNLKNKRKNKSNQNDAETNIGKKSSIKNDDDDNLDENVQPKSESNENLDDGKEVEDNDDDDENSVIYYCEICNKYFQSIKTFENHNKSKKHQKNLLKVN